MWMRAMALMCLVVLGGCTAVSVAGTVVSTTVGVAGTVVETTVDAAGAAVDAVVD